MLLLLLAALAEAVNATARLQKRKARFGMVTKRGFSLTALAKLLMRPQAEIKSARPIRAGVGMTLDKRVKHWISDYGSALSSSSRCPQVERRSTVCLGVGKVKLNVVFAITSGLFGGNWMYHLSQFASKHSG